MFDQQKPNATRRAHRAGRPRRRPWTSWKPTDGPSVLVSLNWSLILPSAPYWVRSNSQNYWSSSLKEFEKERERKSGSFQQQQQQQRQQKPTTLLLDQGRRTLNRMAAVAMTGYNITEKWWRDWPSNWSILPSIRPSNSKSLENRPDRPSFFSSFYRAATGFLLERTSPRSVEDFATIYLAEHLEPSHRLCHQLFFFWSFFDWININFYRSDLFLKGFLEKGTFVIVLGTSGKSIGDFISFYCP